MKACRQTEVDGQSNERGRLMAEWHWYCDIHGRIDRAVQVRQRGARTEGRCRSCGAKARWADRPAVKITDTGEQLSLFGEQLTLVGERP
jgi:hypothetical protein